MAFSACRLIIHQSINQSINQTAILFQYWNFLSHQILRDFMSHLIKIITYHCGYYVFMYYNIAPKIDANIFRIL